MLSKGSIAKRGVKPFRRTVGMPQAMHMAKAAGPKTKGAGVYAKISKVKKL